MTPETTTGARARVKQRAKAKARANNRAFFILMVLRKIVHTTFSIRTDQDTPRYYSEQLKKWLNYKELLDERRDRLRDITGWKKPHK